MFVIVNSVESGKNKIKKGRTIRSVRETRLSSSEKFYIIDVLSANGIINWDEVESFIGAYGRNLLMNSSLILPEFTELKRFSVNEFRTKVLFNTMSFIFKQMYLSGIKFVCYLYDKNGRNSKYLRDIGRFAPETVVVTENPYRYISETEYMYNSFGASISVTDNVNVIDKCSVIIDSDGSFDNSHGHKNVFSIMNSNMKISPYSADDVMNFGELCPDYIDGFEFLGAVNCLCGMKQLDDCICSSFISGSVVNNLSDVVDYLKLILADAENAGKSIIFYV